ncbi:MAG TPA: hypothetical protein PKC70_18625, partial [Cellvibrionaceae bacterium]|nr:hypothetical protein [Cellvibrionaceae bacterium]
RAMQEQLPSLHAVNEHFFAKFNDARASELIFQRFPRGEYCHELLPLPMYSSALRQCSPFISIGLNGDMGITTTLKTID